MECGSNRGGISRDIRMYEALEEVLLDDWGRAMGESKNMSATASFRAGRATWGFSSGEGASRELDGCGRVGVIGITCPASERFSGSPARCLGRPKSKTFAGLAGPARTSLNLAGDVKEFPSDVFGLLKVLSGEKTSWTVRLRRFAGLITGVAPGESGRLFILTWCCLLSWTTGRNW